MSHLRRAVILPVVLMVIVFLALLGAAFSFRIHADSASTQAVSNRTQTRLAAEAGIEWVKLLLRKSRLERSVWYKNPDAFNRVIVWAYDEDSRVAGTTEKLDQQMAYRFSIVADDLTDDEMYIRFGITDEASRVNLNTATEFQLLKLVKAAAIGDDTIDVKGIVDAILDWRDADSDPRSEDGGTEGEYYKQLAQPYRVKNGPFDSVEELLLVKGVTANLLYGEDFDRNGLLTDNEDDGNQTFPPDNEDGLLNRGLYPYLTVFSYETQSSNANRPRVDLLGDQALLEQALDEAIPDEPSVVDFCVAATRPPPKPNNPQGPNGNNPPGNQPGGDSGAPNDPSKGGASALPSHPDDYYSIENAGINLDGKLAVMAQRRPDDPPEDVDNGKNNQFDPQNGLPELDRLDQGDQNDPDAANPDNPNAQNDSPEDANQGDENEQQGTENQGDSGDQSSDALNPSSPIRSPAYLLFPRKIGDQVQESPVRPEHLAVLMDRTTVSPSESREVPGLININTAPRLVLECIEGLTSDQVNAILTEREALDDAKLSTTAWLVTEGIVDNETFARIAPSITARGQQFRIQSLGYADHVGTVTRLEVVLDLNGPIAETIYYRDISYLGAPFPIREEDREQQNAR